MKGLILAGGKSTRFGSDKALAFYDGAKLLEKSVDLLTALGLQTVVVTRAGADYPFLDCPVLIDELPDKGPMGGIYTAMNAFKEKAFLVLTCDMPALTSSALSLLLSSKDKQSDAVIFCTSDGRIQPFPGIYEPAVFSPIRDKLLQNDLSMHGLLEIIPQKKIIPWEGALEVFSNVNKKEDLGKLPTLY